MIGIEGHNPSGHCLVASKLVDSLPLSVSLDEDLPPAKKQATGEEVQPIQSDTSGQLSVVCKIKYKALAVSLCNHHLLMIPYLSCLLG